MRRAPGYSVRRAAMAKEISLGHRAAAGAIPLGSETRPAAEPQGSAIAALPSKPRRSGRRRHDIPGSDALPVTPCRSCRGKHSSLTAVWPSDRFNAAAGFVLLFVVGAVLHFIG